MPPKVAHPPTDLSEVFKAFADPIRWAMVVEMSQYDEYPAANLEELVGLSRPTISYHVKVLYHAGLIEVRKEGRNFYYRLRRDVVRDVIAETNRQLGIVAKRRAKSA
ncbi:metalloregulator ArsR/SmtB family transcription factor [Phytohabitans sp. ZYX-F-186]|uniref:Metalloregulator ArsR/SmtB family transcription factor n=1 Tax=Phytohabitans maris TaxID=3071409 RepID=A0ABU0ZWW2_9ACTN|nr:metalloregulator ArsR/SmtB family transcription factor [Phytohabitans sp. ZYX-F-186]MDQ7910809.1 metalloregulator ArsR/SmtB family transcription factor [Phytohabitans sp. ZYX-F-186]